MFLVRVIVFCFAILAQYKLAQSACSVSINKFIDILPMDNNQEILYPGKIGNILETAIGKSIYLECPSSQIVLKADKQIKFNVEFTEFKCGSNNQYANMDPKFKNYNIVDFTCDSLQPIELQKPLKDICDKDKNLKRVEIGFQIKRKNIFRSHIEVCWDNQKKTALYAKATIKSMPSDWKVQADRPFFRPGQLFEKDLEKYFTRHFQMYNLCKSPSSIPEFIKPEIVENSLLDKGHLVANADFPYDAQQRLTFQYTNAAPQWGNFNKQNWRKVEEQIRRFVVDGKKDLDVYTGTHGNFKMNEYDYYLHENKPQIPVPKYFWKIILKKIGPTNKPPYLGVAILGLNDIFTTEDVTKSHPCKNVLPSILWLYLPNNNVQSGYVIACEIKEFEKIPNIMMPSLPVSSAKIGLLKSKFLFNHL